MNRLRKTAWAPPRVVPWLLPVVLLLVEVQGVAVEQWFIETVAGSGSSELGVNEGPSMVVFISQPFGVELGPDGRLYVTEVGHHRVWAISLDKKWARVVAGSGQRGYAGDGGLATHASLNEPYEVRFDRRGTMYFVEMQNHLIRAVDPSGIIRTVAGTGEPGYGGDGGPAREARFRQPHSIALDSSERWLFVADIGNHRIRRVDLATGLIDSIAGDGSRLLPQDGQPAVGRPVLGPRALFTTSGSLWVALREGHSVWRLDLARGTWQHLAGNGQAGFQAQTAPLRDAAFHGPKGIALDAAGNIYIADTENHAVRMIDMAKRTISTIAGQGPQQGGFGGDGGPALQARLNRPHGICVGPDGSVYVGDTLNHRVRRIYRKQR
ncbi:MAG: hypothetical protein KatS3mg110_3677 [Pirellulaceae bacterium]|nr:MAG: hypothetical protein KatS3mg110_3677 [Pirellulaceae bacterium]